MKFTVIFSILSTLLSFAYAQTCQVNLVNNNRTIRGFQARADINGRCRDALRKCALFKRTSNYPNARCEEVRSGSGSNTGGNNGDHTGGNNGGNNGGHNGNSSFNVMVGDTVLPSTWNSSAGARVLYVDRRRNELRVESNSSRNVYTLRFDEVAVTSGCLERNLCVGDNVLIASWNSTSGADIIGINFFTNKLVVQSRSSHNIYQYNSEDLYLRNGCLQGFCVDQRIYPRSWNSSTGAQIMGISRTQRSYIVKSNSSGNVYVMTLNDF